MRPLVRAALIAAALAALSRVATWLTAPPVATRGATPAGSSVAPSLPCPPRTLSDGRACVPIPARSGPLAEELLARDGASSPENQIPLRPDREAAITGYRWPVRMGDAGTIGDAGRATLPTPPGAEVTMVALEHQVGDAEVLLVASDALTTLHAVRGPGELRRYLLFHTGLASTTPGLAPGTNLRDGAPLGTTHTTLELEVREVRREVDVTTLDPPSLRHPARTIPCDPRNVLVPIPPAR